MKNSMRRLGTVGTGLAISSAMALVLASPAFAETQWPGCAHMQTGWTQWKETDGASSITPFWGIWRDKHNNLVRSETQYIGVSDYMAFRIYGEGNHQWALAGVYVDDVSPRGAWCQGPDDSALNNAVGDDSAGRDLPVGPLPAAGYLPISVEVPPVYIMHG